jgi:signal transduction histidine kinase
MASDLQTASIDENLNIVFCNQKFADLFKISINELQGKNILQNFPFNREGKLYKTFENLKRRKKILTKPLIFGIRLQNYKTNQHKYDFFVLLRPYIEDKQKKRILIVLAGTHDAEVQQDALIESLEKKNSDLKKMEELDKLKSEFLATLSHELKTPLVSIKGYLELMASEKFGSLNEKQRKALTVSLRNTGHLNLLISSILNFARMEAGKLKFDLAGQSIAPLLNDTIDSMQPIADKFAIKLNLETQPDLPKIIMDSELINRVITNLLDNAIKFSQKNSEVTLSATMVENNQIKICVTDSGCGIPPDKLEKIKEPFFQAEMLDTRPKGGLGLGLAICQKILKGHDTHLEIDSTPGEGSRISFKLKRFEF